MNYISKLKKHKKHLETCIGVMNIEKTVYNINKQSDYMQAVIDCNGRLSITFIYRPYSVTSMLEKYLDYAEYDFPSADLQWRYERICVENKYYDTMMAHIYDANEEIKRKQNVWT